MEYQILKTKMDCRNAINNAMSVYQKEKIHIEFISLSIKSDDVVPIMTYFLKLIPYMLYKKQFGVVDYCGCLVGSHHLHFMIRKNFVYLSELKTAWQSITDCPSNIYIKSVKYDMEGKYQYVNLLSYILNQDDHHFEPITFIQSPMWGIVIHKKRDKKNSGISTGNTFNPNLKNRKYKYEESYLIGDKFVSKEEYDRLIKDNAITEKKVTSEDMKNQKQQYDKNKI